RYAGVTAAEAQQRSMDILDKLKDADGIFCPNESSTLGMLKTLEQAGLAGEGKLRGVDAPQPPVEWPPRGRVPAPVLPNPVKIGYEGVKAAVAAVRGQTVAPRIDTGVRVVTKGDLDDPQVKTLLGL